MVMMRVSWFVENCHPIPERRNLTRTGFLVREMAPESRSIRDKVLMHRKSEIVCYLNISFRRDTERDNRRNLHNEKRISLLSVRACLNRTIKTLVGHALKHTID
ncbi:MAG: hypothetical protein ACI8RD_002504 [Bacillariaceae sp.]|jgi:hypothetical protein